MLKNQLLALRQRDALRSRRARLGRSCGPCEGRHGQGRTVSRRGDLRGAAWLCPDLRQPVIALGLGGLRRRIEALMSPGEVIVTLNLDKAARLERDRRRLTGRARPGFAGTSA